LWQGRGLACRLLFFSNIEILYPQRYDLAPLNRSNANVSI